MRFRSQTADALRPQPTWLRALALFCVLLLGSVSTAQAAHIHGQWLPHTAPEVTKNSTGPAATTEDACPLCVAMHSALPVATVAAPVAPILALIQALGTPAPPVLGVWHFELFSRPPPVLS